MPNWNAATQKARPKPGFSLFEMMGFVENSTHRHRGDQPRVRERIMKLSKVYSATCHHRYSSER
jgi:hypothetical protein